MITSFTYETTNEFDHVVEELEVRVVYKYFPYQPACTPRGEYQPIDPPEPAHVEVEEIEIEDSPFDGKHWRQASDDEFDTLGDWFQENWQTLHDEEQEA
jgi:hypothetical protein